MPSGRAFSGLDIFPNDERFWRSVPLRAARGSADGAFSFANPALIPQLAERDSGTWPRSPTAKAGLKACPTKSIGRPWRDWALPFLQFCVFSSRVRAVLVSLLARLGLFFFWRYHPPPQHNVVLRLTCAKQMQSSSRSCLVRTLCSSMADDTLSGSFDAPSRSR